MSHRHVVITAILILLSTSAQAELSNSNSQKASSPADKRYISMATKKCTTFHALLAQFHSEQVGKTCTCEGGDIVCTTKKIDHPNIYCNDEEQN